MVIYACVCACKYFYDPPTLCTHNKCILYIVKTFPDFINIILRLEEIQCIV